MSGRKILQKRTGLKGFGFCLYIFRYGGSPNRYLWNNMISHNPLLNMRPGKYLLDYHYFNIPDLYLKIEGVPPGILYVFRIFKRSSGV